MVHCAWLVLGVVERHLPEHGSHHAHQPYTVHDVSRDGVLRNEGEEARAERVASGLVASLNQVVVVDQRTQNARDEGCGMVERHHEDSCVELGVAPHVHDGRADVLRENDDEVQAHESKDQSGNDCLAELLAFDADEHERRYQQRQLDVAWHEPGPWEALVVELTRSQVVDPEYVGSPLSSARRNQGLEVAPDWSVGHQRQAVDNHEQGDDVEWNVS